MKIAALALAPVTLFAGLAAAQALPLWERAELQNRYVVAASGHDARLQIATDPRRDWPALRSLDGGRTWDLLVIGNRAPNMAVGHPTLGNVIYASNAGGSLDASKLTPFDWYQSRDGGATWRTIPISRLFGEIRPGADPDLLYASEGSAGICFNFCEFEPGRAMVSTDAGETWRSVDAGLEGVIRKLYPTLSDSNGVYALTPAGVYSSRDRGTTWRKVLPLALSRSQALYGRLVVDRLDANVVHFAALDSPMQVTEDGGNTWRVVEAPPDTAPVGPLRLVADPAERGRLYYATAKGRIYERRAVQGAWRLLTLAGSDTERWDGPVGVDGSARTFGLGIVPVRIRVDARDYALGSGLWWNPAMSGTGLSITQRESQQLFAVWFTFDAKGDPIWYVMPGGRWLDRDTFEATLYVARGRPAGAGYDPALHSTTRVGTATLAFEQGTRGTFRYRFDDGRTGEMAIEPQRFGDIPAAGMPIGDYGDLWWNPLQPGWGLGVAHQGARVFMTWFTYDANGAPTWAVVSDARVQGADNDWRAVGALFRARGPAAGQPFGPGSVSLAPVGTLGLTWTRGVESGARVEIEAFGRAEEPMTLSRQPF